MIAEAPGVWLAALAILGSAVAICFASEPRRAVISLWIGQLASGSVLLSAGAETLAVLMWIACTLVASVYFFHADLLGSTTTGPTQGRGRALATKSFHMIASLGVGVVVWWLLELAGAGASASGSAAAAPVRGPVDFDERFVLVELLAGAALAAAIATGVITRAGGTERNAERGGAQ